MKTRRIAFLITLFALPLLLFQNCGQLNSGLEADLSSVGYTPFDEYPSTEKTDFYNSIVLYNEASQTQKLKEFRFVGSAAYIENADLPVDYEVRISTNDGMPMCPTKTGTLLPGASTIEFDCVANATSSEANVVMKVKAGTAEHTFTKKI